MGDSMSKLWPIMTGMAVSALGLLIIGCKTETSSTTPTTRPQPVPSTTFFAQPKPLDLHTAFERCGYEWAWRMYEERLRSREATIRQISELAASKDASGAIVVVEFFRFSVDRVSHDIAMAHHVAPGASSASAGALGRLGSVALGSDQWGLVHNCLARLFSASYDVQGEIHDDNSCVIVSWYDGKWQSAVWKEMRFFLEAPYGPNHAQAPFIDLVALLHEMDVPVDLGCVRDSKFASEYRARRQRDVK